MPLRLNKDDFAECLNLPLTVRIHMGCRLFAEIVTKMRKQNLMDLECNCVATC